MAEKAPPKKRRFREFTSHPSAGRSAGGDGGDGDGDRAAAPASAPQKEPPSSPPRSPSPPEPFTYNDPDAGSSGGGGAAAAAPGPAPQWKPSSSFPRSPSPPKPLTYNPGAGSSGGGGGGGAAGPKLSYLDTKDSDVEKPDEFKTENGWGSLFMSDPEVLSKDSSNPQNLPHYIGRQDCEPLSTQEFFSLRHNWQQLLDGKKTYLRRAAESNYADCVFVTPESLDEALGCQEPLSHLVRGAAGKPNRQQKFKILSEHYVCFRPVRSDGSQFYRAFLFSYLENLGKMQGSQAEVTRLMECVARSRVNFLRLKWNNAYFSNPEAFFSSVVSEFEHLVNSVANGLNAVELYKISLEEISSSRILSLLRLLTEVHIRTYEANYNREVVSQNQNEKINALLFCKESVRPFDADVSLLQMKALSQALGIPLHLAAVDGVKIGGTVQVKCIDIIPRSGPLSSTRREQRQQRGRGTQIGR
ncbi:uncharacterized protein LOC8074859 isoform X5 [Sorghum bicolor]|uniref:uncharacterized protein LOC8074859 isoform X5 n=1 Tax=Sorghum bicolor TaxID=4558 RepID=UPI000B4256F5|nr:uncharacterized protein LOC8074859 isoform X5 [Sorghum bicolor]XP_021301494.1 uncharacterized protein LOC8074859 isoform X5 [Sorghum bicolor]|eukprot:XP_021301493.1 uncharacterized protein LOC8074859 isoform X5 [Sorghum bicolor]